MHRKIIKVFLITGSFIAIGSFLIFSSNNLLPSRKFYENNESIKQKKEEGEEIQLNQEAVQVEEDAKILLDTSTDDVWGETTKAQAAYKERAEQRARKMSLYGYNVLIF